MKAGYEAYRRSAESTSRDQTGELQPMEQVGTHAPALFAAQAGIQGKWKARKRDVKPIIATPRGQAWARAPSSGP